MGGVEKNSPFVCGGGGGGGGGDSSNPSAMLRNIDRGLTSMGLRNKAGNRRRNDGLTVVQVGWRFIKGGLGRPRTRLRFK